MLTGRRSPETYSGRRSHRRSGFSLAGSPLYPTIQLRSLCRPPDGDLLQMKMPPPARLSWTKIPPRSGLSLAGSLIYDTIQMRESCQPFLVRRCLVVAQGSPAAAFVPARRGTPSAGSVWVDACFAWLGAPVPRIRFARPVNGAFQSTGPARDVVGRRMRTAAYGTNLPHAGVLGLQSVRGGSTVRSHGPAYGPNLQSVRRRLAGNRRFGPTVQRDGPNLVRGTAC